MEKHIIDEAVNDLTSLGDVLRWGASRFDEAKLYFGHGTDNAWDEVLALAMPILHLNIAVKTDLLRLRLTHSERRKLIEAIALRICSRLPVAYITHEAYFAGLKFYVDQRVIIPRSPIAELIDAEFKPWLDPSGIHRILDLCAGSACIAIACAYQFPDAKLDAIELSEDALAVAKKNCQFHQVADQVTLIKSDLFVKVKGQKYDLIVANPPYVDAYDMANLPQEFWHEPRTALAAGEDGLSHAKIILREAINYLTDQGVLIMEVGNSASALIAQFPQLPFTWLQFEHGGEGVCLLTKDDLLKFN